MSAVKVNFVSAEGGVWEGEAEYVSVHAIDGAMGIMAGMEPHLALLSAGPVVITEFGGEKHSFVVTGGFCAVDADGVNVVADEVLTEEAAREAALDRAQPATELEGNADD
ncbi:F0F1 ATP synthase subunit epsilon [Dermabacter sp. p3-SID358]|uniref:F0F1 ATP synthase subunit epsilon n=1 Tax=Dermabacter sp. p3-SID358 TaxID=2916114 RepID=UPI0021A6969C|nr:F0F1 ATP synthase subunit epsilon [Dermabacter sp. p3-SID358]MCT1866480.1 F0F1 ATP synthase subunit epsilon [Dermabacter sp. p3-SID358]